MEGNTDMADYRIVDLNTYYRKGVFRHFTEDCKCSTSMTARIDVTALAWHSKAAGTKFYLNFLYLTRDGLLYHYKHDTTILR